MPADAAASAPHRRRVVWGHEAIGKVIDRKVSEVRWLIHEKRIRVRKHGKRTFSAIEDELLEDVAGERLPVEDDTEEKLQRQVSKLVP